MNCSDLTNQIKSLARDLGFERAGVARAEPMERADYVRRWLEGGNAGEMKYLHRYLEKRLDPAELVAGAKSVIVVALNYHQSAPPPPVNHSGYGKVAMYAWGNDYHKVVKDKLWTLIDQMRELTAIPFEAKPCVDTAPLIERELAMKAGIGWIGKNTLVLNEQLGSYFFLGEIVTTLELDYDRPAVDHCGSCRRCLDACPTDAFPQPYQMDARRCISYHTIELRSDIPEEFHQRMDGWVFGCDVCQQVCPFNQNAPKTEEPRFAIRAPGPYPLLCDLLDWQIIDYRNNLKNSAIKRAKLDMIQRNARIAVDSR